MEKIPQSASDNQDKKPEKIKTPETSEIGGRSGPDPTRYGDYEVKGKCVDF